MIKISRKKLYVFVPISLAVLVLVFFVCRKASAYYQANAKIAEARQLEGNADYTGSLAVLGTLGVSKLTPKQRQEWASVDGQDTEFSNFDAAFSKAVGEEGTTLAPLAQAKAGLQTISPDYPAYAKVTAEISKIDAQTQAIQIDSRNQEAVQAEHEATIAEFENPAVRSNCEDGCPVYEPGHVPVDPYTEEVNDLNSIAKSEATMTADIQKQQEQEALTKANEEAARQAGLYSLQVDEESQ